MPVTLRSVYVPAPPAAVWAWHAAPTAFERLGPPWWPMRLIRREGGLLAGAITEFEVTRAGVPVRWLARHVEGVDERLFVDVQDRGPFRSWRHEHRFVPEDGGTRLEDEVTWEAPTGLGWASGLLEPDIDAMFRWRHHRTVADLQRLSPYADAPRLRVGITGASGLVGRELTSFLIAGGHTVVPIARDGSTPVDGLDAVVNLAGDPIADGRWTAEKRRTIRESRVDLTRRLCERLAAASARPAVLVSGSAVGFYGDRGDEALPETAAPGAGFLAETCVAWEAATAPAAAAGIRVVHLRTGIVLSPRGGWLATMTPIARTGAAGPAGSGRQWTPWIDLDDLVGAIHHAIRSPTLAGPVNGCAPEIARNSDVMHALGRALSRPSFVPTPAVALQLALGADKARELVLASQNTRPDALVADGFRFVSPTLEPALRRMLGSPLG